MTNRRNEKRNGDGGKRVFVLLGSLLVLAGLVSSGYSALVLPGIESPLRYDRVGTSEIAGGSSNLFLQLTTLRKSTVYAAPGNTITVTTTAQGIADDGLCSLQEAIYSANLDFGVAPSSFHPIVTFDTGCAPGSGDDTIALEAGKEYKMTAPLNDPYNPVGPTANPIVLSNMTIEANGARLVRENPNGDFTGYPNFRAFVVAKRDFADPDNDLGVQGAGTGSLLIRNAHIKGFTAKGGDGRAGGGGGMGAGGAVYVKDARLSIENSTFERNGAGGGRGSVRNGRPGGGGGGMGGDGGYAQGTISHNLGGSGAGGGGARGDGAANGFLLETCSPNPCWFDMNGGGGGGTLRNGGNSDGYGQGRGFRCGGGGAGFGNDGSSGECPGGGGGGGEPDVVNVVDPDGDGGNGNYGGGGGGGGSRETSTFFDGGGGGNGGFGGGGGAGGQKEDGGARAEGGRGGFGGGGGAGGDGTGGIFGYFGGDGTEQYGGGGAGLGGAVFSHGGTVTVWNSTFTGNYAVRGTATSAVVGGDPAENGSDAGGAIFTLDGKLELYNSTIARNETTGDLGGIVVLNVFDQFGFPLPPTPSPATLIVKNTIIANNGATADGVVYTNTNGEVFAGGFSVSKTGSNNLITDNYSDTDNAFPGVTVTADPQLSAVALNTPGLTPTMEIASTSPAVNAGADLMSEGIVTDQRGVYRRPGAYDIGAYEILDNAVPVATGPNPAPSTNEDTAVAVGLSATDDDDDALTFTVTDGPDNGTLSVTTGSGVAADCAAANSCTLSVQYTPAANFNGTDSFKFKANDGQADSEEVTVAITVTPVNDAPVVSATPLTQPDVQYSDPVQPVTITASDVETPAGSLAISASYKRNGGSTVAGLPAGLAFTDNGVTGASRQWTVSGKANVPAGVYVVKADVTDRGDPDNVGSSPAITTSVSFTINVIRENVVVSASSALSSVKVASPGGTSPQFALSASLAEESDGSPGDITKASPVSFTLSPIGGGSSPTCSNAGAASGSTLTVNCTFSNVPVGVYEVNIVVGGDYYTGGGSTVLTVFDPSLGFVSGGGWIVNPVTGYRGNFGVNVKYLKNGKAQGQIMYIEHRPNGDLKVKSNAMQNVAILNNEAQVTAKANYGEVGNFVVIARVIDNGDPGKTDKFGLKLLEPSGRVVSDLNFLADPVLLGGGNNQVPKK